MNPPSRWNLLWALPWMVLSFLLVEVLVWLPLMLSGLVVMPLALRWAETYDAPSRLWPDKVARYFRNPILQELYGNWEDGLCPQWWKDVQGTPWTWFLRNNISNMRYWPVISTRANLATRYIGDDEIRPGACFVAWSGGFVGFRFEKWGWGIWAGMAVNPRDAHRIDPLDWRSFGYSTVAQIFKAEK